MNEARTMNRNGLEIEDAAVLSRIASSLAHLVRNAVASVTTNAEVLQDSLDEVDPRRDQLVAILHETGRIQDLIRGFVEATAPLEMREEAVDLVPLVRRLERSFLCRAEEDEVTLNLQVTGEGRCEITSDPNLVFEALERIVENAFDAAPQGGQVRIELLDEGDEGVLVRVEDSGPGAGDADPQRWFEPLHSGASQRMGLGLTIARKIVTHHGGEIEVGGSSLGGARFDVRFPRGTTA